MSIVGDVFKELFAMFLGDATLALATLFLVAVAAGLVVALRVEPLVGGGVLLLGCLVILVASAGREARARNHP